MPFAYYKKLSPQQKKIYDQSDSISSLRLPWAKEFEPFLTALHHALKEELSSEVQRLTQKLADALCQVFQVSKLKVKVLAERPNNKVGELHGLYQRDGKLKTPLISVWMRTSKRSKVVAFKTYLRTFLHEIIHHLDYELLKLPDSLHTQGFYQRENSLFNQIFPKKLQKELKV